MYKRQEVRAILLASDHSVWYATAQGVVQQTPDGKLIHFNEQNGLPAHFSMGFAEDREGRIWIATGTGLAYIQQGIVHTVSFPEHSDAQHAFSLALLKRELGLQPIEALRILTMLLRHLV